MKELEELIEKYSEKSKQQLEESLTSSDAFGRHVCRERANLYRQFITDLHSLSESHKREVMEKNEAVELLEKVCSDLESGEYQNGQVTFEEVSCFIIKSTDPQVFKDDLTDPGHE